MCGTQCLFGEEMKKREEMFVRCSCRALSKLARGFDRSIGAPYECIHLAQAKGAQLIHVECLFSNSHWRNKEMNPVIQLNISSRVREGQLLGEVT